MHMIQTYHYNREMKDFHKIKDDKDGLIWIHVENPTEEEIQTLMKTHRLPRDYIASVLDPDETSRVEKIDRGNYLDPALVILLYPVAGEDGFNNQVYETRPLSMVLTEEVLITAAEKTPDFMQDILDNNRELVSDVSDKEDIVLEISWHISILYVDYLKKIHRGAMELEKSLSKSTESKLLYQMAGLEKSIIYFEVAIEENHPVIEKLKGESRFNDSVMSGELIRDVNVENHQAEMMIRQTGELIKQLNQLYSSIVSNNLNMIMKVLTSITIVLTIPTIIGGIWGMNINLPFMGHARSFEIVLLIMLVLSGVVIWLLKKYDYF